MPFLLRLPPLLRNQANLGPRAGNGASIPALCEHADLAPTLLAIAGQQDWRTLYPRLAGRDLLPFALTAARGGTAARKQCAMGRTAQLRAAGRETVSEK